jgi:ActR/RegA family two-component response regulator
VSSAQLREQIEAVLTQNAGNVSRAAREFGVHRTQLRRYLERFRIDPQAFAPANKREG